MTRTSTPDNWSSGGGPEPDVAEPEETAETHHRSFLAELPVLIAIAFILALVLKTFLIQAFYIPSASMEPTLLIGDRVLVNKVVYRVREPRRGEIVVFSKEDGEQTEPEGNVVARFLRSFSSGLGVSPSGEKDYIKRIIGLPGETIEMKDGVVSIDGREVPEATTGDGGYLAERDPNDFGPVKVPDDHYFMMGDNRQNSSDSRFPQLGTIPRDEIIGRAFVTIWPVERLDTLPGANYADAGLPTADAPPVTPLQPVATLVR